MKYGMFMLIWLALAPGAGIADSSEVSVYFDMAPEDKARFGEAREPEHLTSRDLARLVSAQSQFLGYIGSDYTRLHIGFTDIHPTEGARPAVQISGYLRKGAVYCEMDGLISADRSHDLKKLDYGVDNRHPNSGIKRQGMAFGSFELNISGSEACAGSLEGRNRVSWMLMEDGSLKRNDIGNVRYLRGENQYSGVWKRESVGESVTVNWGEYRIPHARPGLDIGAGEFSVNPEYIDRGWQDL